MMTRPSLPAATYAYVRATNTRCASLSRIVLFATKRGIFGLVTSIVSTIASLSRVLIREYPEEYKLYSLREFEYGGIKQQNRNGLLARDPSVDGIKTGHTESAGYCLASSAKRGDTRLISVVLGTKSFKAREDASAALLNYGFTFFETVKVKGAGDVIPPGTEARVGAGDAVVFLDNEAPGTITNSGTGQVEALGTGIFSTTPPPCSTWANYCWR